MKYNLAEGIEAWNHQISHFLLLVSSLSAYCKAWGDEWRQEAASYLISYEMVVTARCKESRYSGRELYRLIQPSLEKTMQLYKLQKNT